MKKSLLTLVVIPFLLIGCCPNGEMDEELKVKLYRECIQLLAQSRTGLLDYTTNDDEDYDEAIDACRISAKSIARSETCKEDVKP